jgi:hypothetical protein
MPTLMNTKLAIASLPWVTADGFIGCELSINIPTAAVHEQIMELH